MTLFVDTLIYTSPHSYFNFYYKPDSDGVQFNWCGLKKILSSVYYDRKTLLEELHRPLNITSTYMKESKSHSVPSLPLASDIMHADSAIEHLRIRFDHRVIILNSRSMPRKRTRKKWCKFSRPECSTSQSDVTRDCALLANCPSWEGGWGRSMYSAFPWNSSVSYLSFVYGRSLWAELTGGGKFSSQEGKRAPSI